MNDDLYQKKIYMNDDLVQPVSTPPLKPIHKMGRMFRRSARPPRPQNPRGEYHAIHALDIEAAGEDGSETVVRRPVLIKLVTICITVVKLPFFAIFFMGCGPIIIAHKLYANCVHHRSQLGVCFKLQAYDESTSFVMKLKANFILVTLIGLVMLFLEAMLFGSLLYGQSLLAVTVSFRYAICFTIFCCFFLCEDVVETILVPKELLPHVSYPVLIFTDILSSLLSYTCIFIVLLVGIHIYSPVHLDLIITRSLETPEKALPLLSVSLPWSLAASLLTVKMSVLLRWKAKYINYRFRGRILMASFHLYFLSLIFDRSRFLPLKPFSRGRNRGGAGSAITTSGGNNIARLFERTPILQVMYQHQYCLDEISTIVGFLKQASLSEFDILDEIQQIYQPNIQGNNNESEECVTEEVLQQWMGVESAEDAQLLLKQLRAELQTPDVTYEAFRNWLVDAHENCLSLGCTLVNALKVAGILNRVLTWILVVVFAIFWLCVDTSFGGYVRELLELKTQLLAPAFIVTLTTYLCKDLIQGLIFLFVVHPFNIGDRCRIEDKEVEITEMDTFQTTCKKIDTGEEMSYLNSDLQARLNFIVHKGQSKLADKIELVLDASNSRDIIPYLKSCIENFFGTDARVFENSTKVQTTKIGSTIEMSVCFDHTMMLREYLNPSKCFQRKNTQRSELLMEIEDILEALSIPVAAP